MFLFSRYALPAAFIALAGFASSASAQTVQDGGFESADPGQTTQTDYFGNGSAFDTNWAVTGQVGIDNGDTYVFDGSKSLFLNAGSDGIDGISQNLATDPTQFYTISFYANDDQPGDVLNVAFGGNTVATTVVPANGYNGPPPGNDGLFTFYSFSGLTTASPFSVLSFTSDGSMANGTLELDDISVNSSPVPEASTSLSLGLLLMLGVGGAAWAAKKSQVKTVSASSVPASSVSA